MESANSTNKFETLFKQFLSQTLNIEAENANRVSEHFIKDHNKFVSKNNLDDLNDFARLYINEPKLQPMNMFDLLKFNNINLDLLTETFYTSFYGTYLSKWPEYCVLAENSISMFQGYLLGKVEGDKPDEVKKNWHGHVSAVTVAPQFRRQGLARALMDYLEEVTVKRHDGFFVDLFVRPSNEVAINMYKNLGYIVYRTVINYYSGGADSDTEDAYDMRKAMPRDKENKTVIPLDKPIQPHELEFH